ncbi:MAG: N-acetyl-gamma-glutamyl-phosphate reductase [Candidatus Omnitrophica bacterium]|nr:N-acetyl-gamma-glutamyl-phosphate reductase [Candidatus Omnitrophota bacterium]
MTINVGIIGATGHTGEELISVLLKHPNVRISRLYNTSDEPHKISDVFPQFKGRCELVCSKPDMKDIANHCDLVFLALPHTVSMNFAPKILKLGKKVIDLSADYRLKNIKVFEKFYHAKHKDAANLRNAVYGIPELYRANIKKAKLVANPGCYSTSAILALAPLVALGLIDKESIIIDAKSGVSGAGKKLEKGLLFLEVNEDFRAYKVNTHQHMPEISSILTRLAGKSVSVTFVPHLLPLQKGILSTIYVRKIGRTQNLANLYKKFYKNEPFVRIKKEGEFPRLKDVVGTNFCDIGIKEDTKSVIVISAIDNLLKGASGQAVQNMNIMYKFPETTALL